MSQDIEQYRPGFEAWARGEECNLDRDQYGNYVSGYMKQAWRVWLGCKRESGSKGSTSTSQAADSDEEAHPIIVNLKAPGDLQVGDYVFASRWSDCDPGDPWHVGHVSEIGEGFVVIGEISGRRWKNAMRITPEQGKRIVEHYPAMERNYTGLDYKAIAEIFGAAIAASTAQGEKS